MPILVFFFSPDAVPSGDSSGQNEISEGSLGAYSSVGRATDF